jgi:hypothetical protein
MSFIRRSWPLLSNDKPSKLTRYEIVSRRQAAGRYSQNRRRFDQDPERGAILPGVNYVGLMDDVTIFRRPLNAREIAARLSDAAW